jgi:hypothetical protein
MRKTEKTMIISFLKPPKNPESFLKIYNFPPPPGGTAILLDYIHYYGCYYQVIGLINIITGVSPPHFDFVVFYYVLCQCSSRYDMSIIIYLFEFQLPMCSLNPEFLNF